MIFFRMESPNRIQSLSSFETKSFLVDSSKARRKIVELEQLSNWHDSSSRWRWRHLRTHFVQGKLNFSIQYHFRLLFCIVERENLFEILFCLYWSWWKLIVFLCFLGNLFSHMGRSFLGKSIWFRRIHEVQKVDQRTAIRFEPDS